MCSLLLFQSLSQGIISLVRGPPRYPHPEGVQSVVIGPSWNHPPDPWCVRPTSLVHRLPSLTPTTLSQYTPMSVTATPLSHNDCQRCSSAPPPSSDAIKTVNQSRVACRIVVRRTSPFFHREWRSAWERSLVALNDIASSSARRRSHAACITSTIALRAEPLRPSAPSFPSRPTSRRPRLSFAARQPSLVLDLPAVPNRRSHDHNDPRSPP